MAYNDIKADIEAAVYPNGEREVTALMVQNVLKEMVDVLGAGYQFMGVASPDTTPPATDAKMFYLAAAGTYTAFGLTVSADHIGVFTYNGTWAVTELEVGSGGGGVTVVDNLTSTSTTDALSAKQGKVLNDGKADMVTGATSGNFAGLDANGNLTDSGSKPGDFQTALATQTAYTAKGSATKVAQITTNNLGQVTGISEVTISQPTVYNKTITLQDNGTTVGSFTTNPSANKTIDFGNLVKSGTAGLKIEVVASMPASPDANTIYIVT